MKTDLILSQGRIADRKDGMIVGSRRTAEALAQVVSANIQVCGSPSPALTDDWAESLPAARETLHALSEAVTISLKEKRFPIMVANTCSASIASLPAMREMHPDACLLWIDAHADFNTPATTHSGYLGGMVVAGACGLWDTGYGSGLNPRQVVIIGGHDIDFEERRLLDENGVNVLLPTELTASRLEDIVGDRPVWIHVDWDALEPGHIPADYAVHGGLIPQQIRQVFEQFFDRILGFELAEYFVSDPQMSSKEHLDTILHMIAPALRIETIA